MVHRGRRIPPPKGLNSRPLRQVLPRPFSLAFVKSCFGSYGQDFAMRRSLALLIFESRGDSTPPPKELSLGEGYLDSLPLSHEGVRRDTYFSSTAFPRSCEGAGANYGLSDEGLPWTQGRAAFRKYVASESPTLELQAEMSTLAWDLFLYPPLGVISYFCFIKPKRILKICF